MTGILSTGRHGSEYNVIMLYYREMTETLSTGRHGSEYIVIDLPKFIYFFPRFMTTKFCVHSDINPILRNEILLKVLGNEWKNFQRVAMVLNILL